MHVENARNADLVFVLSKQGKALMPCRPSRARQLIKSGRARVVRRTPFTIRLKFGATGYIQPVTAGMDSGSTCIGIAAVANGQVVYQSEVILRSDIKSKMDQRRMYRRNRRSRKTRYRPARFDNRGKAGKLNPTLRSKLDSHLKEKRFVESILPVHNWKVELANFDIHKISNPSVSKEKGWIYQQGNKKNYYNTKAYILFRDDYTCQQCRKKGDLKLHVHHIQFRSEGGTDAPSNLITLCESCHHQLHQGELGEKIHIKLTNKIPSKTKHATETNILKSQLKKSEWSFQETFGYETKLKRESLNLPKEHYFDAVAICLSEEEGVHFSDNVIFKRHVSHGDYQQTSGARSEKKIPTGKLYGIRKFDRVRTPKGTGFVKGKRSTGFFAISELDGTKIHDSVNVKKDCTRLSARRTTLTSKGESRLLPGLKALQLPTCCSAQLLL
jgi:5-methylcytosine-specific restriction endonuclease McrA